MTTADLHQPSVSMSGEAFDRPQCATQGRFVNPFRNVLQDVGSVSGCHQHVRPPFRLAVHGEDDRRSHGVPM